MGSDENDAGKGQGSIGQSGPIEPLTADGDKGQRTKENNKRYENQNIRRALHFSCIGGIQRLRHLIIYSHLKKNAIADTCSEECIGEDCPQAYPAEENGRQQQQQRQQQQCRIELILCQQQGEDAVPLHEQALKVIALNAHDSREKSDAIDDKTVKKECMALFCRQFEAEEQAQCIKGDEGRVGNEQVTNPSVTEDGPYLQLEVLSHEIEPLKECKP